MLTYNIREASVFPEDRLVIELNGPYVHTVLAALDSFARELETNSGLHPDTAAKWRTEVLLVRGAMKHALVDASSDFQAEVKKAAR